MTEAKAATLEDLKAGASVQGLTPSGTAKVVNIEWFGDQAVKVIFEDANGSVQNHAHLLSRLLPQCFQCGAERVSRGQQKGAKSLT